MASLATDDQLNFLRTLLGEPTDPNQARWTPTQLLSFLNSGRRRVSEETRCVQIKDSQATVGGTKLYSLTNDVISWYELECGGRPLRIVRPEDWRDVVGRNDDLQGTPVVAMYHARQIQLYYVPSLSETLRYHGWGYANDLVIDGVDADFLQQAQEASAYAAAIMAKMADERNPDAEEKEYGRRAAQIATQYRRRGAKYVRDVTVARRQIV